MVHTLQLQSPKQLRIQRHDHSRRAHGDRTDAHGQINSPSDEKATARLEPTVASVGLTLGAVQPSQTEPETSPARKPSPLWLCPKCGGRMVVIERLTAAQIQLRSPPSLARAAA
jgi:hypothetical protein